MLKSLGHSEQFQVMHAWDLKLERSVAIKSLRRAEGVNAERWGIQRERFEREAFYLQLIKSEQVVKFHQFFQHEGTLYLVMEHLEGLTLRAWMERVRPTARQFLFIISQLCKGLRALHRAGLVHRDIKPANILVTRDKRVVLIDLGIAYDMVLGFDPAEHGLVRGTPGYLAPEQLVGVPLAPHTDIYSVGVLMFELATGQPLFNAGSLQDLLVIQMAHRIPSIRELLPDSKDRQWRIIGKVIRRCLKKKQTARYESTNALWQTLEKAL